MVGGEKETGEAEGRLGREEVEASSKARRVSDRLPPRKDNSFPPDHASPHLEDSQRKCGGKERQRHPIG